jgi:hypothetical protein
MTPEILWKVFRFCLKVNYVNTRDQIILYRIQGEGWAVVVQSVKCLITEWTTGIRSPAEAEHFSSILCVQTSSEAHPASYPMDT